VGRLAQEPVPLIEEHVHGPGQARPALAQGLLPVVAGREDVDLPPTGATSGLGLEASVAPLQARVDRLDVLVNNAGGVNKARRSTMDGIEATFAVNHVGCFLLTNLLLDRVVKSAPRAW